MSEISFKQGDDCEEIGDIKRKFASLDRYSGEPSWTFDEELRRAICRFQLKRKLAPTGICDTATWNALDKSAGSLFSETFQYELDALRGTPASSVRPAAGSQVIQRAHGLDLAGLAFSGGGIRSAT